MFESYLDLPLVVLAVVHFICPLIFLFFILHFSSITLSPALYSLILLSLHLSFAYCYCFDLHRVFLSACLYDLGSSAQDVFTLPGNSTSQDGVYIRKFSEPNWGEFTVLKNLKSVLLTFLHI